MGSHMLVNVQSIRLLSEVIASNNLTSLLLLVLVFPGFESKLSLRQDDRKEYPRSWLVVLPCNASAQPMLLGLI